MPEYFLYVLLNLLLIYVPRVVVIAYILRSGEPYDNRHPRLQQAKLTGLGARAQAAHENSIEMFALFAPSVIIAHLLGAPNYYLSLLSLTYFYGRLAYIIAYLANWHVLRSIIWTINFLNIVALYFIIPLNN
ncbi:MAG: MAPEG family protein [Leptospiraceae bacterium]|nr:MAPEG family protein [Leptospiraceae bacterium]MDW8305649.1 MAPEG family protein [Leptospiraceae bacterium]